MFVFSSVHSPQPGKEELWVQKMRQFDELINKQPGIIFVSDIFTDPKKGTPWVGHVQRRATCFP